MAADILICAAAGALLSAALVALTMPLLRRYALADPNVRSSHAAPTPQGAGMAVMLAMALAVMGTLLARTGASTGDWRDISVVIAAAALLAATGALDDLHPLGPLTKLLPQVLAVGAVIWLATPEGARLVPALPLPVERGLALLAGIWFVNLVNFMDGIDWITVVGCGMPLAALALFGLGAAQGAAAPLLMAALCGALIGFSPFNKPVARVFLGDVGSLPIGLVLAYGLYRLALDGHLAAAIILPLYYVYDSGLTLIRRALRREKVWQAHRGHVYQRATDAGWSVTAVVGHVAALNLVLAGLAALSVALDRPAASAVLFAATLLLVALVCRRLAAGPGVARGGIA